MDIGILVAHLGKGPQFQCEQIRFLDVAVATAVADHGIALHRLVVRAAAEIAKLVAAEVRCSVDHRAGREGGGDSADRGGHGAHHPVLFAAGHQGAWMLTGQRIGEHELLAQQPHAVDIPGHEVSSKTIPDL